jgi:hypothetical protein
VKDGDNHLPEALLGGKDLRQMLFVHFQKYPQDGIGWLLNVMLRVDFSFYVARERTSPVCAYEVKLSQHVR